MSPKDDSVTISVRVQPRASRNALVVRADGSIKIWLTAPPVKGAANKALIDLLSEKLRLPRYSFEILSGNAGRNKLVRISGCSEALLHARLSAVN